MSHPPRAPRSSGYPDWTAPLAPVSETDTPTSNGPGSLRKLFAGLRRHKPAPPTWRDGQPVTYSARRGNQTPPTPPFGQHRPAQPSGSPQNTPETAPSKPRFERPDLVPLHGLHHLVWLMVGQWLYPLTGWDWLVRRSNRERFDTACKSVWDLRHVQKIFAVVNSKGGSVKTSTTVYLGKLHAFIVKQTIVALDANVNSGHTAKRMGILRESTLQLRTFIKAVTKSLQNLPQLFDQIEWEPETGLGVIASEKASNANFSLKSFKAALLWLKDKIHSVWCDLGNGIMTPSNVGSVDLADTLIFPGLVTSGDSLDDILSTQQRYIEKGYGVKVHNGIIVIVGIRRFLPSVVKPRTAEEKARLAAGEEVKDRSGLHLTLNGVRKAFAAYYEWPLEQLFVVPRNHYMKRDKPAKLSRLPLRVKVVLAEALVAALKADVVRTETGTAEDSPELTETAPEDIAVGQAGSGSMDGASPWLQTSSEVSQGPSEVTSYAPQREGVSS